MNPLRRLNGPTRAIVETVLTLVVALAIAYLAQAFLIKPYRVPSGSMEPTLLPGDRVLADRISLRFETPHRFQIVVFHPPHCKGDPNPADPCAVPTLSQRDGNADTTFIKRVIGLPGDTLFGRDGHVWLIPSGSKRARPLHEPYLHGVPTEQLGRIRVPQGYYFLMGDNRGDSDDSRKWGPEKASNIIGIARARYWPVSRIGGL